MKILLAGLTLPVLLAACAAPPAGTVSSAHITPHQCQDLAALRQDGEATHGRLNSEVAALLTAGYYPAAEADTYPASYLHAQRRVNAWYAQDCRDIRLD
jgi:hypothetical protein